MESHVFGKHLWDFVNGGKIQSKKVCPHISKAAHSSKRTTYQAAGGAQFVLDKEEMTSPSERQTSRYDSKGDSSEEKAY